MVRHIDIWIERNNEKEIKNDCAGKNRYIKDLRLHVTSSPGEPGMPGMLPGCVAVSKKYICDTLRLC